jgi:lipoprotein signal peptidase
MTLDTFTPAGRLFYEISKKKLTYSLMMAVAILALLAMVSKMWGLSAYNDSMKKHQIDDEMEDAYNALSQGYGFSGFCNFLAFLLMLGTAVYYSPLLCGWV